MSFSRLAVSMSLTILGVCLASADASAQSCQPPNMLIVQDISASMDESIGSTTKFDAAFAAVTMVTNKYGLASSAMKIRFGLEIFATVDQSNYPGGFWCDFLGIDCPDSCLANNISVGVADANAGPVQNKLGSVSPWSDTPMRAALDTANSYTALRDGARQNFVLLVTDGMETCDSDPNSPIQSVTNLKNNGIKTYVVGFGSGVDAGVLNAMATAGGTAKAGTTKYYQCDNQAELQAALDQIASQVAAGDCTVPGQLGECAKGVKQCVNGQITCGQVNYPTTESCDGKDHNCNGQVDDVSPRACNYGCGAGTESCSGGQWVNCTAPHTTSQSCDNGCGAGSKTCTNGTWSTCNAPVPNSCGTCSDTKTCDNGCGDIGSQTCVSGNWTACTASITRACDNGCGESGTQTCSGGSWGVCSAPNTKACINSCGVPGTQYCSGGTWSSCDAPTVRECDNGCGVKGSQYCSGGNWTICDAPTTRECDNGCGVKGTEVCTGGNWTGCSAPTSRECDNGCGDKGIQNCAGGNWTACTALSSRECTRECGNGTETCSGGAWVDCTAPAANSCGTCSDTQECSTICGAGTATCTDGVWNCDARKPTIEICNGFDDDCDGTPDNGDPGGGLLCATGLPGECAMGTTHCIGGQIECIANKQASDEICDGFDNDCDGVIDNGVRNACGGCGPTPVEVCNGRDDDCDSVVDNSATCPDANKACVNGECVGPCVNNECPLGYVCRESGGVQYCVSPCNGVHCELPQECDPLSGQCFDPCQGVTCEEGKHCYGGQCISDDCHESGCPIGYICVSGTCQQDPCAGVECKQNELCVNGQCVPSCATVSCPLWQHCEEGQCVGEPCDKVTCPEGKRCVDGECVEDPCQLKQCGTGYICVNDECVDDPCLQIKCPDGQICKEGKCSYPETVSDGGVPPNDAGTGDGGVVNPDSGLADGGVTVPDGGKPGDGGQTLDSGLTDGSVVAPDGGTDDDGGHRDGGGGASESSSGPASGCSCSAVSLDLGAVPFAWLAAALSALAIVFMRRRG